MAKAETWTWRDLITPASVLTIGAIAVTVFAWELRGIETRLTDMDSKSLSWLRRLTAGAKLWSNTLPKQTTVLPKQPNVSIWG